MGDGDGLEGMPLGTTQHIISSLEGHSLVSIDKLHYFIFTWKTSFTGPCQSIVYVKLVSCFNSITGHHNCKDIDCQLESSIQISEKRGVLPSRSIRQARF